MKKSLYYSGLLLFSIIFSIAVTFMIFATEVGSSLSYIVFLPLIENFTQGMGESGFGVGLYTSLILNFIYGILVFKGVKYLFQKYREKN